ncbi:MAG TPA: DUF3189 family protein [Bacillota bacterium]|nr:DUF3189 family protein [Bacillota bacterium]HPT87630.1 DUF3189 family protein [Bacillota bacterium]
MKVFYYCFAGTHSSVIAAAIHLNRLPMDRIPDRNEILNTVPFDLRESEDIGIPYFMGIDECGHEIYVLGFGKDPALGLQVVQHLIEGRADHEEWKFFNTLPCINWTTRCGGYLSRRWKWVGIGRFLLIRGIRQCYPKICKLVQQIKEWNPCQEKLS